MKGRYLSITLRYRPFIRRCGRAQGEGLLDGERYPSRAMTDSSQRPIAGGIPMSSRPRLKSHAQPLRRGPGSLQLGLCPDAGVVLDGLTEAEIAMAEGLDGSLDTKSLYAAAAASGVDAERVSELITVLNEHHLLVDTDRAWLSSVGGPPRHPRRPDTTAIAIAAAYGLPG